MSSAASPIQSEREEGAIKAVTALGWHHLQPDLPINAIASALQLDEYQAEQLLKALITGKKIRAAIEFPATNFIETGQVRISRFKWIQAEPNE